MQIQITAEHIKNGKRNSCTRCPIALALLEKNYDACVAADYLQIKEKPSSYWQYLQFPKAVKNFIQNYDTGLEVFPFSFNARKRKEF